MQMFVIYRIAHEALEDPYLLVVMLCFEIGRS